MDITMPQLGETVTEGTITRWLKQVGDHVRADEPLFEVSTDKVDSEVPAPNEGWVTEIRVPEGETVSVGSVLAVLSSEEAAAPTAEAAPAEAPSSEPPPADAAEPAPAAESTAEPAEAAAPDAPAAERAPEPPAPPPPATAVPATPAADGAAASDADARVTSPVVRRLLAEHGLAASSVRGTGEGGRVTRRDVLDAVAAGGAAPAPAATAPAPAAPVAPAPQAAPDAVATPEGGESRDTVVPFTTMRRLIAEHTIRSLATTAHVSAAVEVDFERVERVRQAAQDAWRAHEGFPLNYLPFVSRAVCDAVDEFPVVNASIDANNLVLHGAVHLAIAVDLNFEGLVTPVIRDADGKRLRAIAPEIKDLAERARAKRLSLDLLQGGTFTITNPGPFGTFLTLPIINEPQVAILATDGIQKRPVVVEGPSGEGILIAVHHMGMLALTWDHRAFDGAYAAAFLRRVKQIIETRDWDVELD